MPVVTVADLKKRRKAAQAERDAFQPLLDEAFDYAIPYRRSTRHTGKGEKRVNKAFDHTAITSAFRFAGKLQQDLWPTGQENFQLEPGAVFKAAGSEKEVDALTAELSKVSTIVGAMFLDGEWDNAFHEMALELAAGTGAMLMLGGKGEKISRFITVPIDEILLEGGPYNEVSGIFWGPRRWTLRAVKEEWPDAPLGKMADAYKEKPETEIEVNQDTVYVKGEWVLTVWSKDTSDTPLHKKKFRACPWLTPRYFRVPGETMGRGPIMLAMPTIKTLNTAQKIMLQAAAIAMIGIYTAVDDGVFNPDNAPVEPGSFWKVARNGGVLGPSVAKFPDPNIDLSMLVLDDMRQGVKATLLDDQLPPLAGSVRSPTEIMERVRNLASDHVGAFGRLVSEIVVPVVRRQIEIAYDAQLIPNPTPIDQLLVKVRVVSPLATAREAERVTKILQWLEIVLAMLSERAPQVAKIQEALVMAGRAMGVPEELIVTTEEREAMIETEAQQQEAAMAMSAVAAAGGEQPMG